MGNVQILPNRRARDAVIALETRGYRVDLRTGQVRARHCPQADLYAAVCAFLRAQEAIVAAMVPPSTPHKGGPDDAA